MFNRRKEIDGMLKRIPNFCVTIDDCVRCLNSIRKDKEYKHVLVDLEAQDDAYASYEIAFILPKFHGKYVENVNVPCNGYKIKLTR